MMKTLVTVGPNSLNLDDLSHFAEKTKLFRLNGSHSTIEWHKKAIGMIRDVSPDSFILMDIPGIKPRTENLELINIKQGEIIHFGKVLALINLKQLGYQSHYQNIPLI